jgi:ribonuclease HII
VLDINGIRPDIIEAKLVRPSKKLLLFKEEKVCESQGYQRIAGIDEVGRGCLAGPVVAAAVVIPRRKRAAAWYRKVNDSKLLTAEQREEVFQYIQAEALSTGVGIVSHGIIDAQGMTCAVQRAMKMSLEKLSPPAEFVLIDYFTVPDLYLPQKGVANGDSEGFSIACASIVAKVTRDKLMLEMDSVYPGYGLARNKGYGTPEHLDCLRKLGPCPIHRRSFQPVRDILQGIFIETSQWVGCDQDKFET